MNKARVSAILNSKNIWHRYYWSDAGYAIEFLSADNKRFSSLVPIGDDEDESFAEFVEQLTHKTAAEILLTLSTY